MTIKQNLHDIVEYCSRASSLAYNNYTQLSTFVDDLFMFNSILVSNCSKGLFTYDDSYSGTYLVDQIMTKSGL